MRRLCQATGVLSLGFIVVLTGGTVPKPAQAGDESPTNLVRIGLVSSLFRETPEPLIQAMMRPFKSLMEAQTGLSGELVSGGDADHLAKQLMDGKLQLGLFHGFELAWAKQKLPRLRPLMIIVNHDSRLRAHLVVRRDNPVASIADLKGKSLAVPLRTREHCRLFAERRCIDCDNCGLERFFAQIVKPVDAEDALDSVIDGQTEAALIDGVTLTTYKHDHPNAFAKLRVFLDSEVFPAAAIVYCPGQLDEGTLRRFRDGMLSANQNRRGQQLLTLCRMTGFQRVPDDYEQMLLEIAKAYPPPVVAAK